MRFISGDKALNETQFLKHQADQAWQRYVRFGDAEFAENEEPSVAKPNGATARLETDFGMSRDMRMSIRDLCSHIIDVMDHATRAGKYNGFQASWKETYDGWPRVSKNGWSSAFGIPQYGPAQSLQMLINGVTGTRQGRRVGCGYFQGWSLGWGIAGDLPNITGEDVAAWPLVLGSSDATDVGKRRYKLMQMVRNTFDVAINPTIGWILPTQPVDPPSLRQVVINALQLASLNGSTNQQTEEAAAYIRAYYIPLNRLNAEYNFPIQWAAWDNGDVDGGDYSTPPIWWAKHPELGGRGSWFNPEMIRSRVRAWSREILAYRHPRTGADLAEILESRTTWQQTWDAIYGPDAEPESDNSRLSPTLCVGERNKQKR